MTEEQKKKMIAEVIEKFDFEAMRSYWYLTNKNHVDRSPTIDKMKVQAERALRMALEHFERESWWVMSYGFVAYIDKQRLALLFVPERSSVLIENI